MFKNHSFHEGSHSNYTNRVRERLQTVIDDLGDIRNANSEDISRALQYVNLLNNRFRRRLDPGTELLD